MEKSILICIPARYGSTRLPAKPLAKIAGVEMITRVARIAAAVTNKYPQCEYIVATDDERILTFCEERQIPATLSSPTCKSGTERCWDVVQKREAKPDFIVNLQGDNPLCPPWFIETLIENWIANKNQQVITPMLHLDWNGYDNLKENKKTTPFTGTSVLIDKDNQALAFSKNIIPAVRNEDSLRQTMPKSPVRLHIGLYGYTYSALQQYFAIEASPYELPEGLEQMRYLHHQIPIKMVEVDYRGRRELSGIDSPEDVVRAEAIIAEFGELELT